MRIVLTGGSGLLGAAVLRHFGMHRGEGGLRLEVRSLGRSEVDLVHGDSRAVIRRLGGDYLIHMAGDVSASHLASSKRPNLEMMENLVGALPAFERVIAIGSAAAYALSDRSQMAEQDFERQDEVPATGYAQDKRMSSLLFLESQDSFSGRSLLMLPNLYGPKELGESRRHQGLLASAFRSVMSAKQTNAKFVKAKSAGGISRQFLHIDDVAEWLTGVVTAELQLPKILNLGSNEEITVKEAFESAKSHSGYSGQLAFPEGTSTLPARQSLDFSLATRLYNWRPSRPVRASYESDIGSIMRKSEDS